MINSVKLQAGHADIDTTFQHILPKHGREEREGQIALCHTMFDSLVDRKIALCDAGVGLGKRLDMSATTKHGIPKSAMDKQVIPPQSLMA